MLNMPTRLLGSLLLVASVASVCRAQDTWGGLRFGMKLDEVKKIMGDRIQEPDPNWKGDPNEYVWTIKSVRVGDAEGKGTLIFSKSVDQLLRIGLQFSGPPVNDDCHAITTPVQNAKTIGIIGDVSNKLLESYGKPIMDENWPSTDQLVDHFVLHGMPIRAERMWKSSGQVINETLSLPCSRAFIGILYRPTSKDAL
jgi:hypothetical protein